MSRAGESGSGGGGGGGGAVGWGEEEEGGVGIEGSAALSLLSWDDSVAPKAPLQLQVLQLLPQLLPLLLLLLLAGTQEQSFTETWRCNLLLGFLQITPISLRKFPIQALVLCLRNTVILNRTEKHISAASL